MRLTAFYRRPQRVPNHPTAFLAGILQPTSRDFTEQLRVVFADVVEIVRHGPPHIQIGIVLEQLEQSENRRRIALKVTQSAGPRETRARAFGNETSHVRARIRRPLLESRERLPRMALQ